MTKLDQDIILFTYDISVTGRKIDWYLTLRGLRYIQCEQPDRMPRPDLEALGIKYRRIPILAIGRDIYIDTRLIIEKLERLFPNGALGSKKPFEQGLEKILQTWSMDGGLYWRTAQCIPDDLDIVNDPKWMDDRSDMIQQHLNREGLQRVRPEALAHLRLHIETLEYGLLANGRKFVLETETPSLADIHAIWTFEWLTGDSMKMGEHLDQEIISSCRYPKLYAWIERFRDAVDAAEAKNGAPAIVSSKACIKQILKSGYWEREGTVDEFDPLGLRKGQMVEVFPTDSGFSHRDSGELVALCKREVVIQSEVKHGDGYLRLHFPRINFRVQPISHSDPHG